ncbi:5-methylthioribose kinase [Lewinella aquimaris]|uniref:5-methylthioribose kinase n=1 Tax=Neolewinella aquimaris TaxID=1835722 RepID=A0A840EHV2_9BACT|nr:phosphotransferase [Neolewinella aquimaris]MBB4080476.1 5-methylthioribose kinase [Neolewinella aquimaris]
MKNKLSQRFTQETGSHHYLTAGDVEEVTHYLNERAYLIPGEEVTTAEPAGESNMNVALRVTTTRRKFILKQSRPWVAKFPELAAPVERVLIERDFHQAIVNDRFLSSHMPELLRADPENYVLLLEDLGQASDMRFVYSSDASLTRTQLSTLLRFASELHHLRPVDFPNNQGLKRLNHAHIFDLPFRPDNGFPLDAIYPGLAAAALPFQHDDALRDVTAELGKEYLATGDRLIHGDFYPGSFLTVDDTVFVIDTEFAYLGRPEFDIGVLMAHLLLSRAPEKRILQIDSHYEKPAKFDVELARKFCYVEIMRRIIGIAQLPISLTLDERKRLLERARAGLV